MASSFACLIVLGPDANFSPHGIKFCSFLTVLGPTANFD